MVFRSIVSQLAKLNEKYMYGAVREGGEDKSDPSFKHYINQAGSKYAIRFSQREYLANGKITNVPLYLVRKLNRLM